MLSALDFHHLKSRRIEDCSPQCPIAAPNARTCNGCSYLEPFKYIQKSVVVSKYTGREQSRNTVDFLIGSAPDRKWKTNIDEVAMDMKPVFACSGDRFLILGTLRRSHESVTS